MNMQNLMAQAQKMQRDITKKKDEINGKKEVQKIKILFEGTIEDDDKEALEDMIKIALNKAVVAVDKEIEEKMGAFGSGFGGLF